MPRSLHTCIYLYDMGKNRQGEREKKEEERRRKKEKKKKTYLICNKFFFE